MASETMDFIEAATRTIIIIQVEAIKALIEGTTNRTIAYNQNVLSSTHYSEMLNEPVVSSSIPLTNKLRIIVGTNPKKHEIMFKRMATDQ